MATYLTNEFSFELEGAFTDHTVHVLEARLGDAAYLGLCLSREPLPAGGTLRDALSARVAERSKRHEGYRVLAQRAGEVGGAEAIELTARFRDGGALLHEREAHFAAGCVWYSLSTRAEVAERAVCDDAMERVLATLRFRAER